MIDLDADDFFTQPCPGCGDALVPAWDEESRTWEAICCGRRILAWPLEIRYQTTPLEADSE